MGKRITRFFRNFVWILKCFISLPFRIYQFISKSKFWTPKRKVSWILFLLLFSILIEASIFLYPTQVTSLSRTGFVLPTIKSGSNKFPQLQEKIEIKDGDLPRQAVFYLFEKLVKTDYYKVTFKDTSEDFNFLIRLDNSSKIVQINDNAVSLGKWTVNEVHTLDFVPILSKTIPIELGPSGRWEFSIPITIYHQKPIELYLINIGIIAFALFGFYLLIMSVLDTLFF